MSGLDDIPLRPGRTTIAGAPEGYDAVVVAALARRAAGGLVCICRDDARLAQLSEALAFFAPEIERLEFPAWDCLPYDRISPNGEIASRRIDTLSRLLQPADASTPRIILTTVAAVLQRVAPRQSLASASLVVAKGRPMDRARLIAFLAMSGYGRSETVTEPGEYAVRGSLIDVFPPGRSDPVRFDFFGDEVEGVRSFDAATQRTTAKMAQVVLRPVSEVSLEEKSIARFRSGYRQLFGAVGGGDPLYEAVSAGRRHAGMEHWLPLFHERLDTLFDYLPDAAVILDDRVEAACAARLEMIVDHFAGRRAAATGRFSESGPPYRPVPPEMLYLELAEWHQRLDERSTLQLSPFAMAEAAANTIDAGGRAGADFAAARVNAEVNLFDAVGERLAEHHRQKRRVIIAAVSTGSRDRLGSVLRDHGIGPPLFVDSWRACEGEAGGRPILAVLSLERGFVTPDLAVITEQDILGDRLVRRPVRRRKIDTLLAEAAALTPGDLVVHVDHGIGRYESLETIVAGGAPHDCLKLLYAGGDRLYLPVENIELISRFGSESEGVALDRLGGAAWQARKARMKARIREMTDELIQLAAARTLSEAPALAPPDGLFDEFCTRFPYVETEDQARAIGEVMTDLAGGRPADRLICGDVGFGKTEVALRAAFIVAMDGRQVAVVVPTTLLCRQHYRTFKERFAGYPIRIEELSRLVTAKQAKQVKAGLADGTVDIIIGTHALMASDVSFRDLGLLVVDEEQHFGVTHKEKLKKLKAQVHVLTLTATPIPRTLQMALSGVREMSLMATPPVDRLAVRTYVTEYDPVVIREAILREHYRGSQTFYVCPRIEDLDSVMTALADLVPEVKVVMAHGRMPARDLERAVGAFYNRGYDVLLSTNIIESGLDLPAVNTIIIHRADMFGLAQLYQLRGRVGRSKVRAYAYLTLPASGKLSVAAEKRLAVMQSLDSLGAGFALASHDLDIRGAGNLLGEEQSGHIREVGIELYQQMLEEAVAEARGLQDSTAAEKDWSPQLAIGIIVLIPESYVPDLGVRLGLYRRLGEIGERRDIDSFAAELIDRFGPMPEEVTNLLDVVAIKQYCRKAGIDRIEAGPKGAVVAFRGNEFANLAGLVQFIGKHAGTCKLRPDHRLVYRRSWETAGERLAGVRALARELARIAAAGKPS